METCSCKACLAPRVGGAPHLAGAGACAAAAQQQQCSHERPQRHERKRAHATHNGTRPRAVLRRRRALAALGRRWLLAFAALTFLQHLWLRCDGRLRHDARDGSG